jgi:hypothetical protein
LEEEDIINSIGNSNKLLLSSIIILVGLLIRAYKFNFIVRDFSCKSSVQNFGTMSIGYLIDGILPFKIGTIIRIYLFRKISNYRLTLIIFINILEKITDIFFISLVSFYVLFVSNQDVDRPEEVAIISLGIFLVFILILLLYLAVRKNKLAIRAIWRTTALAGPRVQSILISDFIDLIVYLRKLIKNKLILASYVILTIVSWLVIIYGISIAVGNVNQLVELFRALIRTSYLIDYNYDSVKVSQYGLISIIGIFFVFKYVFYRKDKVSKIDRHIENLKVSSKMMSESSFMDLVYFKSKILSQISSGINSKINILEIYPGGSDAITLKIEDTNDLKERNLFIRKVIGDKSRNRLGDQIKWLSETKLINVPKLLNIHQTNEYLYYDMEYVNKIKAFDYIHGNDVNKFQIMMFDLMTYFNENLYTNKRIVYGKDVIVDYLEAKILKNLEIISNRSTLLKEIISSNDKIIINGVKLNNLRSTIRQIFSSEIFNKHTSKITLSDYCHGDLTIDNMFVDLANIIVIDPSDDNKFSSPLIDLGRLIQSFEGGHEFNNLDNYRIEIDTDENMTRLNYIDYTTTEYIELGYYVKTFMAKNFIEDNEIPLLNLLASSYFIRMIIHNLDISEDKSILFYAKAVIFANNYLNENTM